MNTPPTDNINSSIVTLEVATDIAKDFYRMYYDNVSNRDIEGYTAAEEEKGKPLFYVFNFKGGGFLILAGDYNETPILANNAEGKFVLKGDVNPDVGIWLGSMGEEIKNIRNKTLKPREGVGVEWEDLKNHSFKTNFKARVADLRTSQTLETRDVRELPPRRCGDYTTTQTGPFLTTTWDQGCLYNVQIREFGNYCGKAPTGCVATAMAQVMRFYSFSNNAFNFTLMPNQLTFNSSLFEIQQVANLMQKCGESVYMYYEPTQSGARTSDVEHALEVYGYSTDVAYSGYDFNLHQNEMYLGRPVILDGFTDQNCFLGWWCWPAGTGHAWVSDGFQRTGNNCVTNEFKWSMNWGWGGFDNGFYVEPQPNTAGTGSFQFQRKILHHIHL